MKGACVKGLVKESTAMLDVWVSMCGHVCMSMLMIHTGAINRLSTDLLEELARKSYNVGYTTLPQHRVQLSRRL